MAELNDDLVAVARYERLADTDDAEVAFVVEDRHQGRGLGSVLLEHLAAAARERGISAFVADVLAENARMVRVFIDAGYIATRSYEDGVVHLRFAIRQTEASVVVVHEREQRAEARSIERLLAPGSVAVVGASADPRKVGNAVLVNLRDYGFAGPVHPVHPDVAEIAGLTAYPTVAQIPGPVDLAVVAVPAERVPEVVEQCARKGVRDLVVLSGGYSERDDAGRVAERALVASAHAGGMRVLGPNCLGMVNTDPAVRLNASLAPVPVERGRIGFFSSGALGIATLQAAVERGLGLSTFVSAGNRADVSGNDLLQYWAGDPATEVVLLWLESFGNPRKFARLARGLARRKPVLLVKAGPWGGLALPGAEGAGVERLFVESGVIRVNTVGQMFDVAALLAFQPLPRGRRVAVVGNSAALGVLASDACYGTGLLVADGYPVDVGTGATPVEFGSALAAAAADGDVDAIVAVFVPPVTVPGQPFGRVIADLAADADQPVLSTFLAAEGVPETLRRYGPDGVPCRGSVPSYPSPERAIRALARAVRYAEWRDRPVGAEPDLPGLDHDAAEAAVRKVLADAPSGRRLTDEETAALLGSYGVTLHPRRVVSTVEDALRAADELGNPVALKSADRALRHRRDLGGVRLDLADAGQLRAAYAALPAAGERRIVQAMVSPGVATLLEVTDNPAFGALVSFGVGGVATDLLGDRVYAPVPLTDSDAARLVRAPRAAPLLSGYRGAAPVDLGALEDLVLRVARLADDLPEILAVALNPVLVARSGLTVLTATVTVGTATARTEPGPRRLR